MSYADNRFDLRHVARFTYTAPLSLFGRMASMHCDAKALTGYPGWFFVHMHADYAASVDVSTSDLLGCIRMLQEEWIAEMQQRFPPRKKKSS